MDSYPEINKIISFTKNYYKSNLSDYLHDFAINDIVDYLTPNLEILYNKLCETVGEVCYYLDAFTCSVSNRLYDNPLSAIFERKWITEYGDYYGITCLFGHKWRYIDIVNNDYDNIMNMKWEVLMSLAYFRTNKYESGEDEEHETFELDDEEGDGIYVYQIEWKFVDDQFAKCCLVEVNRHKFTESGEYDGKMNPLIRKYNDRGTYGHW